MRHLDEALLPADLGFAGAPAIDVRFTTPDHRVDVSQNSSQRGRVRATPGSPERAREAGCARVAVTEGHRFPRLA